jgi:hypothetical protein
MRTIFRHLGRQIIRLLDAIITPTMLPPLPPRGVDLLLGECIAKVGLPCFVCDGAHWTHDPVGIRPAVRTLSGAIDPGLAAVVPADRMCATAMYGEDRIVDWPPN